ncbi:MAG: hypothetical protein QQN41_13575, partial [Nitrosopumilus sp.]
MIDLIKDWENKEAVKIQKEDMINDIVLIKSIKRGCYSDDSNERDNSSGGFYMQAGSIYRYYEGPPDYYAHETHIIYVEDINWD